VTGVEPSRWAGGVARGRGFTVHSGTITTVPLPPRSFDVVTMWDVVEHLTDPVTVLARARKLTRDDGWLVVATLNVEAWIARLMGRRWPWYMRMHLIYYTRQTLTAVLARAGWRTVAIEPYPHVVTLGYLARKLGVYTPRLGRLLAGVFQRLGLAERRIAIDFGDCVTAYAVKDPAASAAGSSK
jgi:hypothetical protein